MLDRTHDITEGRGCWTEHVTSHRFVLKEGVIVSNPRAPIVFEGVIVFVIISNPTGPVIGKIKYK